MPSGSLLVGLAGFAVALWYGGRLLDDPDTYLHVGAGRWMLAHGTLPASDPFSHSMPGAHWVVHEWLAELALAATYGGLGWTGLVLLTAGCFGFGLALLVRYLLDRGEPISSLLFAAGALFLLEKHLLARPYMLAFPVMVAWCGALVAARDGKRGPPLALLPLMVLWANLHGSFMVGIGLAGFLGLEAILDKGADWRLELRRWAGFTALAILAALLDPNGVANFFLPLRLMGMGVLHDSFQEWLSPNFHLLQPFEFWLLGLLFAGYAFGLRLPLLRLLFVLGLVHLALSADRHGDIFAVLVPLLASASFGHQIRERIAERGVSSSSNLFAAFARPARWSTIAGTMVLAIAMGALRLERPILRVDNPSTPASALAVATRLGVAGPVLNAEGFGGYPVFNDVPTFIDGRAEMYGPDFLETATKRHW